MFLGSYPLELGGITPIFYAFRRARGGAGRDGGGLRRPDALHVQPGRRPQGGPARRAGWAGSAPPSPRSAPGWTGSTSWCSATRSSGTGPAASACCRRDRGHAYGVSGPIARAPASTSTCGATSPTWPTASSRTSCRWSTRTEGDCLARFEVLLDQTHNALDLADACLDRLARAAAGPDQPAAAQGAQGARRGTRTRGPRTRSASTATTWSRKGEKTPYRLKLRSRVLQQHPGPHRAARRAAWSRTWWRSWGRCSSWSATSTSSPPTSHPEARERPPGAPVAR